MSVIHDTSVEQSRTGNPSVDATWDTCKFQYLNEVQDEDEYPELYKIILVKDHTLQ